MIKDFSRAIAVMMIFVFAIFPALEPMLALADDTGWVYGQTYGQTTELGSPWNNESYESESDNLYSNTVLSDSEYISEIKTASQFGFNIPLDATIDGIEFQLERKVDWTTLNVTDNLVKLVIDGLVSTGDNKATSNNWTQTDTTVYYGGPSDLWGITITPADVNDPDFGIALQVERDFMMGSAITASVDYMGLKIYYTTAAGVSAQITARQQVTNEMSLTVGDGTITMLPSIPGLTGGVGTGTTTITAITNNAAGYTVALSSLNSGKMMGDTAGDEIPAYTPASASTPEAWSIAANTAEFGYTIQADAGDVVSGSIFENLADGTYYTDAATSKDILKSATSTLSSGAVSTIAFRAEIKANPNPSIASDWYVATTTLTMTMN